MRTKKTIALLLMMIFLAAGFVGCAQSTGDTPTPAPAEQSAPASAEPEEAATEGESRLTSETLPIYFFQESEKDEVQLYYLDGQMDIPYISIDSVEQMLKDVCADVLQDIEYNITGENKDGVMLLKRENGSAVEIDFNENAVTYDDFNGFFKNSYAITGLDILSATGVDENGDAQYFSRSDASFQRQGLPIIVDLENHDIETLYEDEMGYIPLQTFSDLFIAPLGASLLYNGQMVAMVAGDLGDLDELYYSAPTGNRSKELAEFSYNELCLALEMNYGLKEAHNIESFNTLFLQTGLADKLMSEDPVEADQALYELCMGYFADMHSGLQKPSYYAGEDADVSSANISASIIDSFKNRERYGQARSEFYPDGAPAYEEVGNTAYVTFDSFLLPTAADYYETPATAEAEDTLGIIMYAHSQIMREDSPIDNVVIDLSNNGGGQADAAIYVISWFLGDCILNINDTLTEAQASTRYQIDANGDRIFDENDTVASKNLYCVISPNSFSCGNLVPAAFKSSGTVTLLGENSGGGACVVQNLTTAAGSMLQVSGRSRISTLSNGSYYDVDQGVEPDYVITKMENFYDRDALTEYVNSLY
ncbi:hypothetical protein LJC56_08980 [Christensenellaceae bacterium OttesenSCG-928-K19]|nr:hypothetical protein [Christensenellaceae bacterium OttesenSCG-928-K19]